ncbi:putative Inactive hydroxysteroid dehydrogenase protein 1 [Fasciola gigantica]|uniref:Putative Inactive hydroxysteroid dehydrogenase protein 1 n=1 Tax=Fasciola gigantica TaxID=46835 RepID=A0A504ZBZ2_FASGI|nr:putative Inactive hydroxysteroid dehydrogenase protein 1 [Fasciola gigantica]
MFCWVSLIAFIVLWKVVFPLLKILATYTVGVAFFSKRHGLKKAGEWAIVTGATDGIGKAYANELAHDGLNIMLISRNMEKLEAVAKELREAHNVKTKVVECDFTRTDIYSRLQTEVNQLTSIACLINNVGMSYPYLDKYADADFMSLEFVQNLIACNINSAACVTRIVLPKLIKQNTPGSAVVNLSSMSGLTPFPYLSLYSASKSFVLNLAEAIRLELTGTNVLIQTVCPMLVATNMSKVKSTGIFVPSAQQYASSALNMLGVEHVTLGWLGHALSSWALLSTPGIFLSTVKSMHKRSIKRFKHQ